MAYFLPVLGTYLSFVENRKIEENYKQAYSLLENTELPVYPTNPPTLNQKTRNFYYSSRQLDRVKVLSFLGSTARIIAGLAITIILPNSPLGAVGLLITFDGFINIASTFWQFYKLNEWNQHTDAILISACINAENLNERAWSEVSKVIHAKRLRDDLFDQSLYSPLQAAVLLQDFELCKKIVELGFSINFPEKTFKQPPLAIAFGRVSKEINSNLRKKDWWYDKWSNESVSQEIALYLIKQGADFKYQTKKGYTYLHFAAVLGHDKVCKILLDKGLDVNKIAHEPHHYLDKVNEITALLMAVRCKRTAAIRILLGNGATYPVINFDNSDDYNPFYLALKEKDNEEIIQAFLDHGAQLDQEIDWVVDKTALLFALNKQRLFEIAVRVGINLEHKFGSYQRTYLQLAVQKGNKFLCEFLIKSGANIHELDALKQNVLHIAAVKPNAEELISLFLQKGVDARVLDIFGSTPLKILQAPKFKGVPMTHVDLEKADKGLSSLMNSLRLLGLRYSLEGAHFEGSYREVTFVEALSLEIYLKNQQDLPPFFFNLPKIIQNSLLIATDVLLEVEQNSIISIACGWRRHGTTIVLTKNFLIKGNRGNECGKKSGMTLYKIKKPSNLSEAVNTLISNRNSDEDFFLKKEDIEKHIIFFNEGLNELLELEYLTYIPQKMQTVGNCSWMAAKMAIEGCLIIYYLQEKLEQNFPIQIKEILNLCNTFMCSWKEYDYTHCLDILEQVEAEPLVKNIIDIEKVYDELFILNFHRKQALKRLCQLRPRLLEWIIKPDPKLISYGYKHNSTRIIKWLLDQNIEPDMSDFLTCDSSKIDELHYDYFVKKGIKANVPDSSGMTPLYVFCMKSRSCPERNVSLTMRLIEEWKKECEPQVLKEALNTTENGLTLLQHLIKDNENLTQIKDLLDLMKQYDVKC